jgi:hypothetical protein
MSDAVLIWLAIAWTPIGPIIGHFDNLRDCRVAVGYAEMQGYPVTECFKVEKTVKENG